jgi:hypothetical protein
VEQPHATPRTRRGEQALEAALEEREIRARTDEPDPSVARPADYDLRDLVDDRARRAAAADVYTPEEALDDLAGGVGHELPDDRGEEDRRSG